MADLVERLFVGGPYDGRREQVHHSRTHLVAHPSFPRVWTDERDELVRTDAHVPAVVYHLHTAPTGERVFLLDGALWNEHVDTEAWPRRTVRGHKTWEHLGPWFWVGTGVDEEAESSLRWARGEVRTYLMLDVSRSPNWVGIRQAIDAQMFADVVFDMQAEIGRGLRADLDFELLPICPRVGCEEKATYKLIVPDRPEPPNFAFWLIRDRLYEPREGVEHIEQLCGEHATELRRQRLDVRPYREEPK